MSAEPRETLRVLRRLSIAGARLVSVEGDRYRLDQPGRPATFLNAPSVDALRARGLIAADARDEMILTQSGRALLHRSLAGAEDYAAQHQTRASVTITDDDGGPRRVTVNQYESPLSWLRHRRGRDGRPLIDAVAFSAGERLRADYSRGQLMPRVTAN